VASASISEVNDTGTLSLAVDVVASESVTEAPDTLAATGIVQDVLNASVSFTEAPDVTDIEATTIAGASLDATEAADTGAATGIVDVRVVGAIQEADDTASSTGAVLLQGAGSVYEAADSLDSAGTTDVVAYAGATEKPDTGMLLCQTLFDGPIVYRERGLGYVWRGY
jgi:hypothetical protein